MVGSHRQQMGRKALGAAAITRPRRASTCQVRHIIIAITVAACTIQLHVALRFFKSQEEIRVALKPPKYIVLCTPFGTLSEVKQRLLQCITSNSEKYNKEVRFVMPWLMSTPHDLQSYVPLHTIFTMSKWLHWLGTQGYVYFHSPFDGRGGLKLNEYSQQFTRFVERMNATFIRDDGELSTTLDTSFEKEALMVRGDLIPKEGVRALVSKGCVLHYEKVSLAHVCSISVVMFQSNTTVCVSNTC